MRSANYLEIVLTQFIVWNVDRAYRLVRPNTMKGICVFYSDTDYKFMVKRGIINVVVVHYFG